MVADEDVPITVLTKCHIRLHYDFATMLTLTTIGSSNPRGQFKDRDLGLREG